MKTRSGREADTPPVDFLAVPLVLAMVKRVDTQ